MPAILLLMAVHVAAAWVVCGRVLRPGRLVALPVQVCLVAFATFYMLPTSIAWATGRIGTWVVLVAAALALGGAGAAAYFRRESEWPLRRVVQRVRALGWFELSLWAVVLLICAPVAYVAMVLPMRWADAIGYHSIMPVSWAVTHRFDFNVFGDPTTNLQYGQAEVFPNIKGILAYLVMDWTDRQAGTAAVQIPFLPLMVFSLYGLFRVVGLPGWAAVVGVIFHLVAPEVLINAMDGYADIVYYAGVYAILFLLMTLWRDGFDWRGLAPMALAFAVTVSAKPFALLMCGVLGVWLLGFAAWRGVGGWRPAAQRAGAALAAVIVACLLSGGPWYIHGILARGNPVYPVTVDLPGGRQLPGQIQSDVSTVLAERNTGKTGLRAWFFMMAEHYRPASISSWSSGLGAHFFILGFPSVLLFLLFGLQGPRWRSYLPLVLIVATMLPSSGSLLIPRYNLYHVAAAGLAFCWLLAETTRIPRILLGAIFAALSIYNVSRVAPSAMSRMRPAPLVFYTFASGDRRPAYFDCFPGELRAIDYWREASSPGESLVYTFTSAPFHFRAKPDRPGMDLIHHAPWTGEGNPAAWIASLRATGGTFFYCGAGSPEDRLARARPDAFRLVLAGNGTGAVSHMSMFPRSSDAIYRILPATEAAP